MFGFLQCGYCAGRLQALALDDDGQPVDTDWAGTVALMNDHRATCTKSKPDKTDPDADYP